MSRLECSVESCNYNKDELCCLEGIRVKGVEATMSDSTACGSFRDKDAISFAEKVDGKPSEKSSIQCEAEKCVYNDQKRCNASEVDIEGDQAKKYDDTCCETFKTH